MKKTMVGLIALRKSAQHLLNSIEEDIREFVDGYHYVVILQVRGISTRLEFTNLRAALDTANQYHEENGYADLFTNNREEAKDYSLYGGVIRFCDDKELMLTGELNHLFNSLEVINDRYEPEYDDYLHPYPSCHICDDYGCSECEPSQQTEQEFYDECHTSEDSIYFTIDEEIRDEVKMAWEDHSIDGYSLYKQEEFPDNSSKAIDARYEHEDSLVEGIISEADLDSSFYPEEY